MSYQKLLQTVLQHGPSEVVALSAALQRTNDFMDPAVVQVVQQLPDFEQIFHDVNALSPTDRTRFIKRLELLSEREKATVPDFIKSSATTPAPANPLYFNRRDVVRVQFGGVGTETDAPHFAVVWHDNPGLKDIVVIPTTSQYNKEYAGEFNVGQLRGLPVKDTILQVHKMTNISRKRIVEYNGSYVPSKVHGSFVNRILYAIAILFGGEISLDSFVRNNIKILLPANLHQFEQMRFWPVRDVHIDPEKNVLYFRKWTELTVQTLQLKAPNQKITYAQRLDIYDRAFGNASVRASGFTDFGLFY